MEELKAATDRFSCVRPHVTLPCIQDSAVQCSTEQYSTVQHSTAQCSTYSIEQYSTVQYRTIQFSTIQLQDSSAVQACRPSFHASLHVVTPFSASHSVFAFSWLPNFKHNPRGEWGLCLLVVFNSKLNSGRGPLSPRGHAVPERGVPREAGGGSSQQQQVAVKRFFKAEGTTGTSSW